MESARINLVKGKLLSPFIASLAMSMSSVSMVGNALRCGERSFDTAATDIKQVPRQPSRDDGQPARNSPFRLTND
jgi:hypothetical protein